MCWEVECRLAALQLKTKIESLILGFKEKDTMTFGRTSLRLGVFAGVTLVCSATYGQLTSAANMQIMQNSQNSKEQKDASAASADKSFVKKVLEGGMIEIQTSQLALQKSDNDELKRFAQRMVDDHAKLGEDMKSTAGQIGVKVPSEPAKKDRAMIARLQGLSGSEFDKAYVKLMLDDHEADAIAFKQEMSTGKVPVVKDAATKYDPVIENHLQMIKDIAKQMNVGTSAM